MKTFKFQQIKSYFLEKIRSGQLKPGERIASEKNLAAEWGVSPLTVGKALAQLERDGYVVRRVGDGSYVNFYVCGVNATLIPALSFLIPTIVGLATPGGVPKHSPACR